MRIFFDGRQASSNRLYVRTRRSDASPIHFRGNLHRACGSLSRYVPRVLCRLIDSDAQAAGIEGGFPPL